MREGTQAGGVGEEEAGSQQSRESDAGLNPRTLGSHRVEGRCLMTEPPRRPQIFEFLKKYLNILNLIL